MKKLFFLLFLLMCGSVSRAQTAEPTLDETVAWIKKTLLAYGQDIKEVGWNESTQNLSIAYIHTIGTVPTNSGTLYYFTVTAVANFISNLSTANMLWKDYDDGVGLEIYSMNGKTGSTIVIVEKAVGTTPSGNNVKFLTDPTTEDRPVAKISFGKSMDKGMQERFSKAMKRLIYLSGGKVEKELF